MYYRNSSTPNGMELMISRTGEPYGITMVPGKNGDMNMLMIDAYGNMYFDPNDRTLGLYIVRSPAQNLSRHTRNAAHVVSLQHTELS
jgi:hypothetical protein